MDIVPSFADANAPTQFWIGTHYLHSLVLLAALDERIFVPVSAPTAFVMAGELAFTKYASVYGQANLAGPVAGTSGGARNNGAGRYPQ